MRGYHLRKKKVFLEGQSPTLNSIHIRSKIWRQPHFFKLAGWSSFLIVSLIKVLISHLTLIFLSSIIDSFKWFSMGSHCRNIQLILVFLKAPSFILNFSYCTSITFLVVLPLILMILFCTLNVIKHMICDNN